MQDIARDAGGDVGERKVTKAVSSTEFLDGFRSESRKYQVSIISEIDRLENLDSLDKIANGKKEEYRLIARQRGINVAEDIIDRTGSRSDFEEATEWLRINAPQRLGYIKGLKTYREKAQGFRLIFPT